MEMEKAIGRGRRGNHFRTWLIGAEWRLKRKRTRPWIAGTCLRGRQPIGTTWYWYNKQRSSSEREREGQEVGFGFKASEFGVNVAMAAISPNNKMMARWVSRKEPTWRGGRGQIDGL